MNCISNEVVNTAKEEKNSNCIHTWHRRLGHRSPNIIKKLTENDYASGIKISDQIMKYNSCIKGKMTRKAFPEQSNSRGEKSLDLVHSNLCGQMKTLTPGKRTDNETEYIGDSQKTWHNISKYCTIQAGTTWGWRKKLYST